MDYLKVPVENLTKEETENIINNILEILGFNNENK